MGNSDETKALERSLEKTEEKLKETERQLAAAQAENRSLKNQVHTQTHITQRFYYYANPSYHRHPNTMVLCSFSLVKHCSLKTEIHFMVENRDLTPIDSCVLQCDILYFI